MVYAAHWPARNSRRLCITMYTHVLYYISRTSAYRFVNTRTRTRVAACVCYVQ